jgi:hypothetical protein
MESREWKQVKFWEDNWLDTSSLATEFWELYVIMQEKRNPKQCKICVDGTSL